MRHRVLVDAMDLAVGTGLETREDPVRVVLGLGSRTGSMGLVFSQGSEHRGNGNERPRCQAVIPSELLALGRVQQERADMGTSLCR